MPVNLIEECTQLCKTLPKQLILQKAQRHFKDALNFKDPDNTYEQNHQHILFRISYQVQRSSAWNWMLFLLSFAYMYLIIGQSTNRMDVMTPQSNLNLFLEIGILALYLADIVMEIVRMRYDINIYNKRFVLKLVFVFLITLDQAAFVIIRHSYPIRPFRFIRSFMPYFFEPFSRKAAISLLSTYRDIIAYLIFYGLLIFGFAFAANQLVNLSPDVQYDQYMSNYGDLGKMFFLIYVLASYDAWPDYELKAVDASKWNYILFVSFIFLNCFYFVTIPTTVIFNSFKSCRSKIVLGDQIKQKQSLILCYRCLEEDGKLTTEAFSRFMMKIYKNKPKYINRVIYLNKTLDPTQSETIPMKSFLKINELFNDDDDLQPPLFSFNFYYYKMKDSIKYKLKLNEIIESDTFNLITMAIILANLVIIILSFMGGLHDYDQYERIFFILFGLQIVIRFLGSGLEQYLKDQRNWLDLGLFILSFLLSAFEITQGVDLGKMIRMVRLFRFSRLTRILLKYKLFRSYIYEHPLCRKLRILFGQLIISCIVGLKMFPIFCTCFYILGLIGMELFDNRFNNVTDSPYRYSLYDAYSSFRNLIQSQLVIVQVMIEAGWSPIVFDYSYRYNNFYGVCLLFVTIHVVVVIILVSLMKGMVGDLYETIYNTYIQIQKQNIEEISKEEKQIMEEDRQLKDLLIENNNKIVEVLRKNRNSRSVQEKLIKANLESVGLQEQDQRNTDLGYHYLDCDDFKHNSWVVVDYPNFKQYLLSKSLVYSEHWESKQILETFQINKSDQSIRNSTLKAVLSTKEDSESWEAEIRSRSLAGYEYKTRININNLMRKVFLSTTSQDYKNAFQFEYFNRIYNNQMEYEDISMKRRIERGYTLIGHFRKSLCMNTNRINKLLSIVKIQELLSKEVIGKGCIFKTIFKLKNTGSTYCYLQSINQELCSLQFIKSGLWITAQTYYDVTHYRNIFECPRDLQQKMRRFVDSFIELKSFSQHQDDHSSTIDPQHHHYSLFTINIPTNSSETIEEVQIVVLAKGSAKKLVSKSSLSSPTQKSRNTLNKMRALTDQQIKQKRNYLVLQNTKIIEVMKYYKDILTIYFRDLERSLDDASRW